MQKVTDNNSYIDFLKELKNQYNIDIIESNFETNLEKKIIVPKDNFLNVVCKIKDFGFDMLKLITSIDYKDYFSIVYHFLSINKNISLEAHVKLNKDTSENLPTIDSLLNIYKSANWLEREVYDLMGIKFLGHTELRRILLPLDWEGYPLRKDYVMPNEYHGITKHDNKIENQENI